MKPSLPLPGMERASLLRRCDIKRIVLERLEGFRVRQAIRDYLRAKKRQPKVEVQSEQRSLFE
jgi:hypothetical protein